jgi:hypothetical protein
LERNPGGAHFLAGLGAVRGAGAVQLEVKKGDRLLFLVIIYKKRGQATFPGNNLHKFFGIDLSTNEYGYLAKGKRVQATAKTTWEKGYRQLF